MSVLRPSRSSTSCRLTLVHFSSTASTINSPRRRKFSKYARAISFWAASMVTTRQFWRMARQAQAKRIQWALVVQLAWRPSRSVLCHESSTSSSMRSKIGASSQSSASSQSKSNSWSCTATRFVTYLITTRSWTRTGIRHQRIFVSRKTRRAPSALRVSKRKLYRTSLSVYNC